MVRVLLSGWHKGPATVFCNEVVSCTVYTPGLVKVISGSKEVAVPAVKLQPGVVALGQLSGLEGVTCQLYTLVLEQPGTLDVLSNEIVVGTHPVAVLAVKSAITSGLTQMVRVVEVIPQLFKPAVKRVIE